MTLQVNDPAVAVVNGYPKMRWTKDKGLEVQCLYECPWDVFPALVDHLQGSQITFAGSPLRATWQVATTGGTIQFNAVECVSVDLEPYSGVPKFDASNSFAVRYVSNVPREEAKVRVMARYETVTRTDDPANPNPPDGSTIPHPGGPGQPSMIIKYFATYGGESLILEGRGFKWLVNNKPVHADISVASHQTIIDHHIVFENAPTLPLSADSLYNKINTDTFNIPLRNRQCEPFTLLFMGYSPSQEYLLAADGTLYAQGWTLEFVLRERPLRWDKFWDPDVQGFEVINPKPFDTAAFAGLFAFV